MASGGVRRLVRRRVRDGGASDTARSLDELAEHVRDRAARSGSEILVVRVVDREGRPLGEGGDVHWRATDVGPVERAVREQRTVFGDAFRIAALDAEGRTAPLSVLFLDLDGFKAVNDGQGHATGDEVLREVGVRVGEALADMPDSLLARWGGDAFVVVLPDVDREGASAIVRRLGCSIARSTTSAAGRAAEALEEADARMYVDKEARREARDEVLAGWRRSA